MKTREEIEAAFRKDFQALLDKYGAEFEMESRSHGHGYMRSDEHFPTITIPAIYEPESLELLEEHTYFELEGTMYPTKTLEKLEAFKAEMLEKHGKKI